MERRKPHTSTADLLSWPENPTVNSSAFASAASLTAVRSHQPSDGISKVVFGGQVTDEEVESLNKRKPCSGYKMKEMTGSGIFNGENDKEESGSANPILTSRTGTRMYQQAIAGMSHVSFGEEESVSPRKPTTVPEVAKQRELSGTLDSESEATLKKQFSNAKKKELSGHDIFALPPEILPQPVTARILGLKGSIEIGEPASHNPAGDQRNIMSSEEPVMKTAKKTYNQKFSQLSGDDIFKGDVPLSSAEKPPSTAKLREMRGSDIFADGKVESRDYLGTAKLREMSGSDIFADGKVESRDHLGGVRKPPGGESSIALV